MERAEIDARAAEVASRAVEAYAGLCPEDLSPRLAPGIVELLDALAERSKTFRLSLVTGNLEPVARLKLERAGIGHRFPAGQGGEDIRARAIGGSSARRWWSEPKPP